MKLCIPVKDKNRLESVVYSHFGSASAFLLYDTEKAELKTIDNSDQNHSHGACQPLNSLMGQDVEVVIVGGIGARAINKLNAQGIRVFQSQEGTAKQNIDLFKQDSLTELTVENACTHHGHEGGCGE